MSRTTFAVLAVFALLSACADPGEKEPTGAKVAVGLRDANARRNALVLGGELQSFKVFVKEISICKDGLAGGNDWCELFYQSPKDSPLSQPFSSSEIGTVAGLAREATEGYVDLLDRPGLAALTKEITITQPGTYRYAAVGYSYALKVTAEAHDGATPVLFTHDGVVDCSPGRNIPVGGNCRTLASTPFTEGPAEEAVMMISTGGNTFDFQEPFEITQQDIDAGTSFKVDLTFDPEGMVQASMDCGGVCPSVLADQAGNGIQAGWPTMTPVPYREGQTLVREKYLGTFSSETSGNFDIRLELFSVKEDPERRVRGVGARNLARAGGTTTGDGGRIRSVEASADGTLSFFGDGHQLYIGGFARAQTAGVTVPADVYICPQLPCTEATPVEFRLVSVDEFE